MGPVLTIGFFLSLACFITALGLFIQLPRDPTRDDDRYDPEEYP